MSTQTVALHQAKNSSVNSEENEVQSLSMFCIRQAKMWIFFAWLPTSSLVKTRYQSAVQWLSNADDMQKTDAYMIL